MDPDLQQRVQQRLAELPANVQAAVRSADTAKKVQAIGARHALHIDQMGALENEVYLVMLGFADPGEFAEQLSGELQVPPQKAIEITTDVGHEIFTPIRESMQAWAEEQTARQSAELVTESLGHQEPAEAPADKPKPAPKPAPAPAPATTPAAQTPTPTAAPKPAPALDLHTADVLLAGKKPGDPKPYKADPYREPVE